MLVAFLQSLNAMASVGLTLAGVPVKFRFN